MKKKLRIPAIQIWACFACPWHIFICTRIKILCILVDSYINLAESVQHFRRVNFQFGLKINATYPGEHSDITSLELWPKLKL